MSITEPPYHDKDSSDKHSRTRMSDRDADELRKLNAAVDRIFKAVPEHPYILSVPCGEPRYHYPSRQEGQSWARNTPFSLDEERLQYMTYIYREPGESCFVIRSQVDEERDKQKASYAHKTPSFLSGTNTPNQSAKKKITLSAYKSKLAGGTIEQKLASPEKEKAKKTTAPTMEEKRANGVGAGPKPPKPAEAVQTPAASGQKRSRADSNLPKSSDEQRDPAHRVKKPRTSTPLPEAKSPQSSQRSQLNGAPHGLPPLLSPTFQPAPNPWGLMPLLSPTLPPAIEAALLEEESNPRAKTDSNTSSPVTDKKTKSHVTSTSTPPKIRPSNREEESPAPKLKAVTKPLEKLVPTAAKPVAKKDVERSQAPLRKATEEPKAGKAEISEEKKPSFIIKIKYGKKNRKQMERILRLPPRPVRDHSRARQVVDASTSEAARARSSSSASQQVERSVRPELKDVPKSSQGDHLKPTPTPEKRPRTDGNEIAPAAKRPKGLDLSRKPSTPIHAPLLSPAMIKSGGSSKSAAQATPRNDHLKSVAMARSASNESNAPTPGGKRTHLTPSTVPPSSSKTGDKGPTSAPSNGPKKVQLDALHDLSQKYNKIGRRLKHENQAIANVKDKDKITDNDRKKAALLGLECILAYMLAYAIGDARRRLEGKIGELEGTWMSLIALFRYLGGYTRRYKDLDGLHSHLGVTIYSRISSVIADRMKRSNSSQPIAADSPQGGPTPDSGSQPTSVNIPKPETLAENWRALTEHSKNAASQLPVEELQTKFPATWASRATGVRDTGGRDGDWEKLVNEAGAAAFTGKYYLPIGVDTTPIQAVRFGVCFVGEWVKKERLEYEAQVKL